MNIILLLLMTIFSTLALAKGKYSDEGYIVCGVPMDQWKVTEAQGYYSPESLQAEGFIHCSKPSQIYYVMNHYFDGKAYILLVTHFSKVQKIVKYEGLTEEKYPHLYGKLKLENVLSVIKNEPHYHLPEVFKP